MSTITVPVYAYILTLYPDSAQSRGGSARGAARSSGQQLNSLAQGLAVPSFWTRSEINSAFAEANRIWGREADIQFSPVDIRERDAVVPADENGMWACFVNQLTPRSRGIGAAFVHDLPSSEGGWGGGRIVAVSGVKARSGLSGFAGNLLAHELGHVLTNSPHHSSESGNLMHHSRNPRVANAGLLTPAQVSAARQRAGAL
jgi:hypothetical protein